MADLDSQIRDYFEATAPAAETNQVAQALTRPDRTSRPAPWAVAIGAAVTVGLAIGIPALFMLSGDGGDVASQPPVASTILVPPSTGVATTKAAAPLPIGVPVVEGGAVVLEPTPAPLLLGGEIGLARSGDTLWAWDADGGVVGYRDDAWETLHPLLGSVLDVAGTLDGTVWALTTDRDATSSTLWHLMEDGWRQLLEGGIPPIASEDAVDIDVDEATGLVWVSTSEGLYRWDGVEMTSVGSPSLEMVFDRIAVTADGTVWAARFNPLFPQLPAGLVRYHPDTGIWESVRPLGGDLDVPAVLAPTPTGNLWVLLADVPEWPRDDPMDWTPPSRWVLAFFDSATGEWTLYRLPDGSAGDVVADDYVVWFTHGQVASEESTVIRFDRQTWTTYLQDPTIDNLGLGNDGTLWASIRNTGRVHRLVTDENATP